jgi:transposase
VASAAQWLEQHPSVEIVSRDRCGLYAQAAREGAPQARQVADRFHLMQNLRAAIEEQMSLAGRATGRALLPDKGDQHDQNNPHNGMMHGRRVRHAHRQSRQIVFDTVRALHKEGRSYSQIARRTGYGRRSIAKWLTVETPPDRRRAALKPTSPLYFEEFLAQCWREGNRRGRHLFHDIRQRGYTGSFSNLERLLACWRHAERANEDGPPPAPIISHQQVRAALAIHDPETGHAISPVIAASLCMKPRGMLRISQENKLVALKQASKEFALMRTLAMRFRGIFRSRDKLDIWIDAAICSGLAPIVRFARVLRRDIDAVRNAVELPWSNGQTEGQINRLKTIKRAMYGRAGAELLKARMLPFNNGGHHTN